MRFIALLLLLLALSSCLKHFDDIILTVDTNAKTVKPENLSNVFQKGRLVKLDSNDSCLIPAVRQVNTTKDFIFVSENSNPVIFFVKTKV